MVSIILGINFYELKERIGREIINRITTIKINSYPLDSAWLLYALSIGEKCINPFFEQGISELERWALLEESGKKNRDLAPLSLCAFLSTKSEIKKEFIKKVKGILTKALSKQDMRFNVLNDPEQIFCASLLLKNDQDLGSQIASVVKKNINGRASRKVLFIASLMEFGENPKRFFSVLKNTGNPEDIISLLWLFERYRRDIVNESLIGLWESFDAIYPSIEIASTEEGTYALSNRDLAFLYEAVVKELTGPDPNMLFDLYPIHPEVKKIAYEHFKHKKYVTAVFEATKKLNEFIQHKTGIRNKSEAELVQATMKQQIGNPKNLVIQFNEFLSEDSGKNEQKGLALITEGIFSAFRNPKGHKPEDHPLVDITPYEALAQLIIIDYTWKRIENAKINVRGSKHA